MPELTTKQWIEHTTPEMQTQLRTKDRPQNVPPKFSTCHRDPNWWKLFRLWAREVNLSGENVDFLDAVDAFKTQPTEAAARQIYDRFVRVDADEQINLPDIQRHAATVTRWYADPDIFETAYQEVSRLEDPERDGAFRYAVERWRQMGRDLTGARTICHDHVAETAVLPVHLSDSARRGLLDALQASPETATFFQDCYAEIVVLIGADTYPKFAAGAEKAKAAFQNAPEAGPAISRPGKVEAPQGRAGKASANKPDPATVKTWNEKALNVLKAGDQTDFFQVGELVVVANSAAGMPPGVVWLQQQEAATGTITMTKKGGAFDPGSIKAEGVSDQDAFKKAIAIFSRKRVEYA